MVQSNIARTRGHVQAMNHSTVTRRSKCFVYQFHSSFYRWLLFSEVLKSRFPQQIFRSKRGWSIRQRCRGMSVLLGRAWGNIRQSRPLARAASTVDYGEPSYYTTARQLSSASLWTAIGMASAKDTATFFTHGTCQHYEQVLKLYPQALRLKADRKAKKPEELIKLDNW